MSEWFSERLNRLGELSGPQQREEVLLELKIRFANLGESEAGEIARTLELGSLFDRLTSNDRELVEQLCDALTVVSHSSPAGAILSRYTPELQKLLTHPHASVKSFALEEILKVATKPSALPSLLSKIDLLALVSDTIADPHLGVAKYAMEITKCLGRSDAGLSALYSGAILRSIAKLLAKDDAVKFRAYEVVVGVAKHSPAALRASIDSGFLQSLIDTLECDDDVLLQLNALECLTELALTEGGLTYLEEQGVLQRLSQQVARAAETPLSALLIPGLMRFFGSVARARPSEMFAKYPPVIAALFEVIESSDEQQASLLPVALDTLGHVGGRAEGKYALLELGGTAVPRALRRIAALVENAPTELRMRGLSCLRQLIGVEPAEQNNRLLTLTRQWFEALGERPMELLVRMCKQPFADLRRASLELLGAVAAQEWGRKCIAAQPGLLEFLTDRGAEAFKDCREAKFEVVEELIGAEEQLFDATTLQRLRKFVKEGPFYVEAVTDVAVEGAS